MEIRTTDTGFYEKVDGPVNKLPEFDDRSGNHFWIIITSYRWSPDSMREDGQTLLDHESLINVSPPICYFCEKAYTTKLAQRRCTGHP